MECSLRSPTQAKLDIDTEYITANTEVSCTSNATERSSEGYSPCRIVVCIIHPLREQ